MLLLAHVAVQHQHTINFLQRRPSILRLRVENTAKYAFLVTQNQFKPNDCTVITVRSFVAPLSPPFPIRFAGFFFQTHFLGLLYTTIPISPGSATCVKS
jgi:hypothetical protein